MLIETGELYGCNGCCVLLSVATDVDFDCCWQQAV
jgi:hypothetical protein